MVSKLVCCLTLLLWLVADFSRELDVDSASIRQTDPSTERQEGPDYKTQKLKGWTVHIRAELMAEHPEATQRALALLAGQLDEIVRVVPEPAVEELQKVPLWMSPEYPDISPRAEYHPGRGWLEQNQRDPDMAKGVEFSNIRIFEAETRRMPNFALHELAHAYHDRVLPEGFGNRQLKEIFAKAQASGRYERVERRDSEGNVTAERSYAMTSPQEYFAEATEAYFSTNDFFPFVNQELKEHDPEMYLLLTDLWGVPLPDSKAGR